MDLLGSDDRKLYNASQMRQFGADGGAAVFAAVKAAAVRGVAVRILLGTLNDPMNSSEVRALRHYPNVQARTWAPSKWYDGGIMHLKLWHVDNTSAYIGSANADWKSLAQVGSPPCRRGSGQKWENRSYAPPERWRARRPAGPLLASRPDALAVPPCARRAGA
jgi:hypothetical protein